MRVGVMDEFVGHNIKGKDKKLSIHIFIYICYKGLGGVRRGRRGL